MPRAHLELSPSSSNAQKRENLRAVMVVLVAVMVVLVAVLAVLVVVIVAPI